MRVISGKYKGKNLEGFDINGTRPTMDRVKESLFGSIQNKVINSVCLDLFAGSGSLGIEALSNGGSKCYFVDNNYEIIKKLEKNLKGIDNSTLLKKSYEEALKYFKDSEIKFDLIFLDPPYKLNLINKAIDKIEEYHLLNDDAMIICEYETEKIDRTEIELLKEKKYGSKYIKIYEK